MKKMCWLSLLAVLTCSCSCAKKFEKTQVAEESAVSYLALGDSYTIGESVEETARFPMQLAERLKKAGKATSVKIIARTGWTTGELSAGIDKEQIDGQRFDFVTLLIGVNNEFRNRPVSSYTPEFEQLLVRSVAFAGGKKDRVFVLSIPDYSYTPAGAGAHDDISRRIDDYNAAAKQVCNAYGVLFIDITTISRSIFTNTDLVAPDGLHPSAHQYSLWVDELFPAVKTALEK